MKGKIPKKYTSRLNKKDRQNRYIKFINQGNLIKK